MTSQLMAPTRRWSIDFIFESKAIQLSLIQLVDNCTWTQNSAAIQLTDHERLTTAHFSEDVCIRQNCPKAEGRAAHTVLECRPDTSRPTGRVGASTGQDGSVWSENVGWHPTLSSHVQMFLTPVKGSFFSCVTFHPSLPGVHEQSLSYSTRRLVFVLLFVGHV